MLCQVCGTSNPDDLEYCRSCQSKLLVVSGPHAYEEQENFDSHPEEQLSFDEHLLERISILEEVMRRTAETVRQTLGNLYKLEQKILINQTGVTTLRDLLEGKRLIAREEWSEMWESRMDTQLMALEKRDRFAAVKDEISALYRGDHADEFRRLLDEAEHALLAFDIETAVDTLEHAHQLDPINHELAFFLGETFFNEGNVPIALEYFRRTLAVKPKHFECLVYSGVLRHAQGEVDQAETMLKAAVVAYPDAFLPAFSLGAIYASTGSLEPAVIFLARAVAADPIPQAHYLLGSCLWEMGRTTAAIRHLEEAVHLDPAFRDAHALLGLAYLDRRWNRKSLAALREAQRLAPKKLSYRELTGLLDAGDDEAVAEVLSAAADELDEGRVQETLSVYRRALAEDPENIRLLIAYAMACLEIGRLHEIESVIGKVLGLDAEDELRATAYATWIEALRTEGRYRESTRLGRLLLDEGTSEISQAIACFEMAYNLAEIEEDLDEALDLARRSLGLAPESMQRLPLGILGWVHFKRREFDEAIDCLERAGESAPNARTLTHLGMALLAAGRQDQARGVLLEAHRTGKLSKIDVQVLECLKDGTRWLQSGTVR